MRAILLTPEGVAATAHLRVPLVSVIESSLRYWSVGLLRPQVSLAVVVEVDELINQIVRDLKAADVTREPDETLSEEEDALIFIDAKEVERVLRQHLEPGSARAE